MLTFTGTTYQIAWKQKIHNVLTLNELGSASPFALSYAAAGKSGYSFGYPQWDLANNSAASAMLIDILQNATNASGQFIVDDGNSSTGRTSDTLIQTLMGLATQPGGTSLNTTQRSLIDQALSSAYGQNTIDQNYNQYLGDILTFIDSSIIASVVDPQDNAFLQTDVPKLFLIDYHNQFPGGIIINGAMYNFIRGQAATLGGGRVQKVGRLGIDDLLNFYFSTKYATDTTAGLNDELRRFGNIISLNGGSITLPIEGAARDEEAKGLIRVYQDFVKNKQGQLSQYANFNARVFLPARDALIGRYVTDVGISLSINGEVIVGEDQTSLPRNTKHATDNDNGPHALQGTPQSDLIFGESGNDQLAGGAGSDVLYGGQGNDRLEGGLGNDHLIGGTGKDTYVYVSGDGYDTIIDEDGQGRIIYIDAQGIYHLLTGGRQTAADSNLYESHTAPGVQYRKEANGDFTILIDGVARILVDPPLPHLGVDLVDLTGTDLPYSGIPYSDTTGTNLAGPGTYQTVIQGDLSGNPMPDTLWADPITQQIFGLAGNDWIDGRNLTGIALYGGDGTDHLLSDDFYTGLYYTDRPNYDTTYGPVKAGTGATLYGEAGNDLLDGGLRDDTLDGGADADHAFGRLGNDRLLGGLGHDALNGGEGSDDLQGNDGNDWLLGGANADRLQGGLGDDLLYGDSKEIFFTWGGDLASSTLLYGSLPAGDNRFALIQDVAEPEAGDDTLDGGDGNDKLFGGAGDDLLYGDAGLDELQGEGGDDILFGGDGNDKLFGDSASDAISNDAQLIPGDFGLYTYYWRERHTGADGHDILDGGAGDDQLWGEGGDDQLKGGSGNDSLYGGSYNGSASGNDHLEGGEGNDLLFGEDGDDFLAGGTGTDQLQGGLGHDTYLFNLGDGQDTIFEDGGSDTLVLGTGILPTGVTLSHSWIRKNCAPTAVLQAA